MVREVKDRVAGMQAKDGIERLEEYLNAFVETDKDSRNHAWATPIVQNLSVVSHSLSPPHPHATFRFIVKPVHANALGNMHGGCTSTLFDICTTLLLQLISRPGFWQYGGVSRTLNVTYLRPVPVGTTVDVECDVAHAGQKLSALRGVMRKTTSDGAEGPVLAICEHGKFNTDPPIEKL